MVYVLNKNEIMAIESYAKSIAERYAKLHAKEGHFDAEVVVDYFCDLDPYDKILPDAMFDVKDDSAEEDLLFLAIDEVDRELVRQVRQLL